MATLKIQIDDTTKATADALFESLGMDTSTAVRMFIAEALECNCIPFPIKCNSENKPNQDLLEAIKDVQTRKNLHGPFSSAKKAVTSMLED